MKKLILAVLAVVIGVLQQKADETEKYRKFAEKVKAEVYGMDLPAFEVRDIPEKYKNESAVMIAVYHDINARKKTGFGLMPGSFLAFSRKARIEGSILERMLIHVADKAAIEKYSEFDFATKSKQKFYDGYEKNSQVMGVRVIKPDGRIVDVNTDDYIEVTEGKKGDKQRRKLAIPGLEAGDNIDVFFYTETKLQNRHLDPMEFYLKDDYPILNYSIHCVVDDNLTTQYRTLNGAPDFKISRDEDKNYVLDLVAEDISGKEPRLWYNPVQQSPLIKMSIFNRRSDQYTPPSARKDGVQSNPDVRLIKEDRWDSPFMGMKNEGDWFVTKNGLEKGGDIIKGLEKLYKEGKYSVTDLTDYYYNLGIYISLGNNWDPSEQGLQEMWKFMDKRKIRLERGMSTSEEYQPLDSLIYNYNALWYVHPEGTDRYYVPWEGVFAPNEIPPLVQWRKAQAWRPHKERKKHPEADSVYFRLPGSVAADNRSVSSVSARIDGNMLDIKRTESNTGTTKFHVQSILTYEDILNGYKDFLNRDGLKVNYKFNKKRMAELEELFADARRKQIEKFKDEVKDYHGKAPASFGEGRIINIGIDPAKPDLTYEVSYTMDGLVKRAGRNMVLSVGKLLNDQIQLLETDRVRQDDVYMRSPREYNTVISVELPAGYRVSPKTLAALNESVGNDAGLFRVTAREDAGVLKVDILKRYNHKILPAAQWPELMKVLDAAKAWESKTVLLEK